MTKVSKKAQHFDWILWILVLLIACALIITIYYLWAGKLSMSMKPWGL